MSTKKIGYGATLAVSVNSVSTTIGNVLSIELPQLSADEIERSGVGDTYKDYAKGIIDLGTAKITVAFENTASHQKLVELADAGNSAYLPHWTVVLAKVTQADSTYTQTFYGFVKSLGVTGISKDGAVTTSVEIQVVDVHGYAAA